MTNKSKHICDICQFESKSVRGLAIHRASHDDDYVAEIKILGKFYRAEGKTIKEALKGLEPKGAARGMSILRITKGDKTKERTLTSFQTAKLFHPSPSVKAINVDKTVALFNL